MLHKTSKVQPHHAAGRADALSPAVKKRSLSAQASHQSLERRDRAGPTPTIEYVLGEETVREVDGLLYTYRTSHLREKHEQMRADLFAFSGYLLPLGSTVPAAPYPRHRGA
jgi:hypothetical protein